jgi:hypothetical protein
MLGTVVWIVLAGLHGALPASAPDALAQARGAQWRPIHILTIVSISLVASSMALLSGTLMEARAAVVGRVGAMIAVPAGAVLGVGFAIGGFVLSGLAESYATAPDDAARAMHVTQAGLIVQVISGTSLAFQTLFGLAILVLSVATFLSREYPHWHCWLGMAGGTIWAIAGILLFVGVPGARFWLEYVPTVPVAIWLLGFGLLAWKHAQRAGATVGAMMPSAAKPAASETGQAS